jgi:hypothetical protein
MDMDMERREQMKHLLVMVCVAVLLGACASKQAREVKQAETMPVNCRTAEGDMRMLRSEKANVAERIAEGAASIIPIGFLVGVATQTEGERINMSIGYYNELLDKKIAEIQQTCGVM